MGELIALSEKEHHLVRTVAAILLESAAGVIDNNERGLTNSKHQIMQAIVSAMMVIYIGASAKKGCEKGMAEDIYNGVLVMLYANKIIKEDA